MKRIFLLIGLTLFARFSVAQAFHLGPLSLGMTNAQILKRMPLSNCHQDFCDVILCDSELQASGETRHINLQFGNSYKELILAELVVMDWPSN